MLQSPERTDTIAGQRHHYIPQFYLKRWAGTDGRLCEYSRPFDSVKARRVHPKGTAFVPGLYTVPDIADKAADAFEKRFLLIADQLAYDALELLLSDQPIVWTEDTRSGWSRFIHSLVRRNPETVARYKVASARVYRDALDDFRANYFDRRRPEVVSVV
jgi:hypothetical protein